MTVSVSLSRSLEAYLFFCLSVILFVTLLVISHYPLVSGKDNTSDMLVGSFIVMFKDVSPESVLYITRVPGFRFLLEKNSRF